jgi:signal transduction histidine kinase
MTLFERWRNSIDTWFKSTRGHFRQFCLVGGLIIILNICLFAISRQNLLKEINQSIQIELSGIQGHLQSALSVIALDNNLVNSVEESNYAESMRTLMAYHESKVADSLLILNPSQKVYADTDTVGAFGQENPLLPLFDSNVDLNKKFRTLILERKGAVYLYTVTQLNSLNGVVGTIIAGENLEQFFDRLCRQEGFAIKSFRFLKNSEIANSENSELILYRLNSFQIPPGWKIALSVPALAQLIIYYILQTLILLILAYFFWSIWISYNEIRIKLKNEQVLRLNSARLVALGEMSAGLAHEINTPLAVIQINTEQLNTIFETLKLPNESSLAATQNIGRILKMNERISTIIKGLRTFSRDTSQELILPVNLKSVVNETLSICIARIKSKEVELRLNLDGINHDVPCRSVQISQVLLNLFNNAYDAIEGTSSAWISVDLIQNENYVEIWVTDSGQGIPRELEFKIMEPFYTTKPVGRGTGIGLSIATGILQNHGGSLKVDSSCKNTRFIMKIPIRYSSQSQSSTQKGVV